MLGIAYSRVLSFTTYNPKDEEGKKLKEIYNFIVNVFDTGLLNENIAEDTDITCGGVCTVYIKAENTQLVDKLKKLKKYDYVQMIYNINGKYQELIDIREINTNGIRNKQ